ncbi:MAG: carboxypeptidase-like regulatory domain-containing protein [Myxococcota bacterium]
MDGWKVRGFGVVTLGVLASCAGDPPAQESGADTQLGACGEKSEIASVVIEGRVRDEQQNWVADVDVQLEEWNWDPGTIHGAGRTDATGAFSFTATNLPVLEDCWGTAVQFWLVGEKGYLRGEQPMNPYLIEAYESGAGSVNTGDVPMILRADE